MTFSRILLKGMNFNRIPYSRMTLKKDIVQNVIQQNDINQNNSAE
jgi:hypothetical protein